MVDVTWLRMHTVTTTAWWAINPTKGSSSPTTTKNLGWTISLNKKSYDVRFGQVLLAAAVGGHSVSTGTKSAVLDYLRS